MKNLALYSALAVLVCTRAGAYTLTFDDIPSGNDIRYYGTQYGATFSEGFQVADHTASTWGPPHSGNDVLVWTGDPNRASELRFGNATWTAGGTIAPYRIQSISAHFSTDSGVVIKMTGYSGDQPIGSVVIGTPEESWNNHYLELNFGDEFADLITFEGVASGAAKWGFCADDMVIVPSP